MTLADALSKLAAGDPDREAAARALLDWVAHAARRAPPGVQDEVVSAVVFKLLEKAARGLCATWSDPEAYVQRMVTNRIHDLMRGPKYLPIDALLGGAREPTSASAPEPESASADPPRQFLASARRALEQLGERFLAASLHRYRSARAVALAQLCQTVFEGTSLERLIELELPRGARHDRTDRKRALDAAYKAHERLRYGMRDLLDRLETDGRLDGLDAHLARRALGLLDRSAVRPGWSARQLGGGSIS